MQGDEPALLELRPLYDQPVFGNIAELNANTSEIRMPVAASSRTQRYKPAGGSTQPARATQMLPLTARSQRPNKCMAAFVGKDLDREHLRRAPRCGCSRRALRSQIGER